MGTLSHISEVILSLDDETISPSGKVLDLLGGTSIKLSDKTLNKVSKDRLQSHLLRKIHMLDPARGNSKSLRRGVLNGSFILPWKDTRILVMKSCVQNISLRGGKDLHHEVHHTNIALRGENDLRHEVQHSEYCLKRKQWSSPWSPTYKILP